MEKLTRRQQQVLDVIREHIEATGYPPTRADIAQQLGFRSANAAEEHLRALARKGAIEMVRGTSRGIRLPEAPPDEGLPVVGRVAAGQPMLALEHVESHCEVPPGLFRPQADFLLRVTGESMREVGINDGDLLAVHSTATAENGQIVVARVDDEVTVKRLKRDARLDHRLTLLPENADFAPIEVDLSEQDFHIEGLGVGVIRRGL